LIRDKETEYKANKEAMVQEGFAAIETNMQINTCFSEEIDEVFGDAWGFTKTSNMKRMLQRSANKEDESDEDDASEYNVDNDSHSY
jgi:hypothetical protein